MRRIWRSGNITALPDKCFVCLASPNIRTSDLNQVKSGEKGSIKWNFTKFLVDKSGTKIQR